MLKKLNKLFDNLNDILVMQKMFFSNLLWLMLDRFTPDQRTVSNKFKI